jgi:hypothetical protein
VEVGLVVGVFLLGSGAGALVTVVFYSGQIRELRRLISYLPATEKQNPLEKNAKRKSA